MLPGRVYPEAHMPGAVAQAASAVRAAVRHVAAGLPTVPKEEKARRLSICVTCEQYQGGRCRACGCFLALKAAMALEVCPLGKW